MYLVVRFMRVASAEALGDRFPVMKNVHVGTTVALLLTLILIWIVPFLQIWVVFGGANQLMASLALLLVTLWLASKSKNYKWTLYPFLFMFITTIAALLYKAWESFFKFLPPALAAGNGQVIAANIIIGSIALVLIIMACFLAWDAYKAFQRFHEVVPQPA
jgi:carbon starvation protein